MSGKRVTRLTPDQRRDQLVGIGLEMLADRSLDELSTDEVARRAGISRGLLFHYFDSKRDFFRAVVRAACDRFTAATEPDPALAPVPWMRAFIAGFVAYVMEHRRIYLALVRGAAGSHPAVTDILDETRETLARRVRDGQRRLGMPDAPRLDLASRAWMAFAEEAVISWPAGNGDGQDETHDGTRDELCAFVESSFVSFLGLLDRPEALDRR
ncbi:TetR/AcrR family transcriptional regulator [Streptomyces chattanoogensis]|uniref:TetR family transcriptional regulator n=1 Tax=Streptomyces chattanoogensis TaxID=66876 RepID=A0A0N0GWJ2_9ACTN|nr:TetR/AcrR family transcriptional regulator [Streptomyces chattanoogensis]KPC60122.1 TetR family transcriptional regulator [Streptomyces chattanoogensis]